MNIPLSPRLKCCCDFVFPGARVADIGCDHGYLSIYLLTQGIAQHAIAADIRPLPLDCAKRNAQKFGVADKMEFYLTDGVQDVPHEFDTLVCAGMGADTMVSILENAPWLQNSQYRLILQCQSKTPMLRKYLSDTGWRITEESVLRDGKFLYTVMEVYYQPDYPRLTPAETYFPPALLENPSCELPAYYRWVLSGLRIATAHRSEPALHAILTELENDPDLTFLKEEIL